MELSCNVSYLNRIERASRIKKEISDELALRFEQLEPEPGTSASSSASFIHLKESHNIIPPSASCGPPKKPVRILIRNGGNVRMARRVLGWENRRKEAELVKRETEENVHVDGVGLDSSLLQSETLGMYCDGKLEVVTTHDVIQLFASSVTALHRTSIIPKSKRTKHRKKENVISCSKSPQNKEIAPTVDSQYSDVANLCVADVPDATSSNSKPVFRRILHDWMEDNGTLKTYTGEVQFMQDNGQCTLRYDGFTDKYFLTVDELFEDYVNGDLRFI